MSQASLKIDCQQKPSFMLYGWFVCLLAALFYCYEFMLRIQTSVMIPELMQRFSVDAAALGIISAMYYFAYTPLQILVGMITDYFGPKKALTGAILLCVLGSLVFAVVSTAWMGGVGRFLMGAGSAFAFVGALKLGAMWLSRSHFSVFVGLTTSLGMIGAIFGDVDMSWMVQNYGWHHVVIFGVVVGLVLLPIFVFFVRERTLPKEPHHHRFTRFSSMIGCLIKVLRKRKILAAGFVGCMLYMSLSVFAVMWGIPFLSVAAGVSKVHAATLNSLIFWGWLVGSPFHGWLSERLESRRRSMIYFSGLGLLAIVPIILWPSMSEFLLVPLLFLFGFFSSAEVVCFAVGRDCVHVRLTAVAISVINCLVMLGGMVLQPLAGVLLTVVHNTVGDGVGIHTVLDYQLAFLLIPVGYVASMVVAYVTKDSYKAGKK